MATQHTGDHSGLWLCIDSSVQQAPWTFMIFFRERNIYETKQLHQTAAKRASHMTGSFLRALQVLTNSMLKIPVQNNICNLSHFFFKTGNLTQQVVQLGFKQVFHPRVYTLIDSLFNLFYITWSREASSKIIF